MQVEGITINMLKVNTNFPPKRIMSQQNMPNFCKNVCSDKKGLPSFANEVSPLKCKNA